MQPNKYIIDEDFDSLDFAGEPYSQGDLDEEDCLLHRYDGDFYD